MNTHIVTGAAGFIGYHLCKRLLEMKERVIGIDNLDSYYDEATKRNRISNLNRFSLFDMFKFDINNMEEMHRIFGLARPTYVTHLAAQVGVTYSIEKPFIYENTNALGFLSLLEVIKEYPVRNLVYASSSSVYGNLPTPYKEDMVVSNPLNMYAATKIYNELQASVYSNLYNIPCTGLRFFTVYGPWGRPDMSIWKWSNAIKRDGTIRLNNGGDMWRNYTYIDDIVDGIVAALQKPQKCEIYNLGASKTVKIDYVVKTLMDLFYKKVDVINMPFPKGEIYKTECSIEKAAKDLGFAPKVDIEHGLKNFVEWYNKDVAT